MTGEAAVPGPSVPPGSGPSRHGSRLEMVLLIVTVVLLALSLVLPWWSETEAFGTETWVQTYSPITGVHGSCSPSCPTLGNGPPLGPIQGGEWFVSLGLNQTAALYHVSLALVVLGLGSGCLALATLRGSKEGVVRPRRPRIRTVYLAVSLVTAALGTALLPVLQPGALRADTNAKFSGGSVWTASPSPETSFWGGCTSGTHHGLCASGGSAVWGPGLGWDLLLLAVVPLIVLHLRNVRPAALPAPSGSGDH